MKSQRIIYILFLMFCININAKIYTGVEPAFYFQVQVDSLYSSYSQTELNKNNTKVVVFWYEERQKKGIELSNKDLKKLAISYAFLENELKAVEYAKKYIKKVLSVDIIDNPAFENIKNSKEYQSLVKRYKPELNGWIFFFFSTGLIGIFIAIVLNLRKKGDTVANLLISLFVLFHSFFMIHLCLFLTKYSFNFPHSLYITASFSFLYGPLLYFYFRRISEKYKFKVIDLLHLVPSIILFLYLITNLSFTS